MAEPNVKARRRAEQRPVAARGALRRSLTRSRGLAALLMGAAALVAGCSSSGPAAESDVERATIQVRAGLFLDDTQTACVRDALGDDDVRAALNSDERASRSQQDRFGEAIGACVPPENLAEAYVNVIRSAAPGVSDEQLTCSRAAIIGLDGHELAIAYVVAANPAAPDPLETASLLERFSTGCDLGDLLRGGSNPGDTATTAPPATDAPPAGDTP